MHLIEDVLGLGCLLLAKMQEIINNNNNNKKKYNWKTELILKYQLVDAQINNRCVS